MTDLKRYEITVQRPVKGHMRQTGEVIALSDREYAAEAIWGGLIPLSGAPAAPPDMPMDEPGDPDPDANQPRKRGR